jgi:hypothetical protein
MTSVLTADPRWYYNLNKRVSKSKSIDRNSRNFHSLKTSYHPDWFVISNYEKSISLAITQSYQQGNKEKYWFTL